MVVSVMDSRRALPSRRSIRLRGYDYSSAGGYVVTICAYQRRHIFGRVVDGDMRVSELGRIVEEEWERTGDLRSEVLLDAFTLMPNHLHGIVILNPAETVEHRDGFRAAGRGLATIVGGFKAAVTRRAAGMPVLGGRPVWQRGFYDRVIRNDEELERFRTYIWENPQKW